MSSFQRCKALRLNRGKSLEVECDQKVERRTGLAEQLERVAEVIGRAGKETDLAGYQSTQIDYPRVEPRARSHHSGYKMQGVSSKGTPRH